jgi:hypothetical protein
MQYDEREEVKCMISILDLITIIGFTWGVFSVGFSLGRAFEKFRHKESRPRPK